MAAYKNYNIQIKGRVQDVGFKNLVENIARSLNLRGRVYNDVDGTVKIVCQGAVSSVKSLIEEIRNKSGNVGASIEEVNQDEIRGAVFLPPIFFKAPTDDLSDISRKLDVGVESIHGIEKHTGAISIKTDSLLEKTDALLDKADSQLGKTDALVSNTGTLVKGQNKMIGLLERIAEK